MRKRNWLLDNLYLVCAIIWYVVAVLKFINGSGGAVTWFCFGSLYLCLHAMQINKRMKEKADQEKEYENKR